MPQVLPPPHPPASAIVVTGRALPVAQSERGYAMSEVDRAELLNSPTSRLEEILKQLPGLQLFRRSDSTSGHPTSQGVTMRALGGNASSRALLILDGVPQADPFGGWVNWPAYDPAGLDFVQITRGGGSVSHGPGALAGAIAMTSRSAEETDASLEVGSRRSTSVRAYFGVDAGGGLLTLNARGSTGRGFVPLTEGTRGPIDRRSPYREVSVRARWTAPVTRDMEVQVGGLGFVDLRDRGVPFTGNRTYGLDGSVRLVGSGRWQWSTTGYAQWRDFRSSFASVNDERTSASRVSLQDSVLSDGFGASAEIRPPVGRGLELRIGADARLTMGESRELYAFAVGEPTRRRAAGGSVKTAGLFMEGSWTRGALTFTAGARLDHWEIADGKLVERLLSTGEYMRDDRHPSRSGWEPTARAAGLVDLGSGLHIRSAAYLGWRLPTLNELFRPFRVGPDATAANPFLDPERLAGAEAELRYGTGPFELSVTAFSNQLRGAIANVSLARGPGIFPGVGFVAGVYRQRQNLDAVSVHGIEAMAEARRGPWSLGLGAIYADAKVKGEGAAAQANGLRPAQTPRLVLTSRAQWDKDGRTATLEFRHSGSQFEDDLNARLLPGATTVNAFAGWPLTDRLQVVARAENLFNETVIAAIPDDATVERATPRTFWMGIRLRP